VTEQQNSGGESSRREGRGRKTDLRFTAADICSPLLVRIVERRVEAVVVENRRGEQVAIHPSIFSDNRLDLRGAELLLPEGVYRHYFSRRRLELAAAREKEDFALMRRHLGLLLSFRDRIMDTPWLSACYSPAWRIGGIPVGGGDYLSLGVLERLWSDGNLLMECPECGGTAHIYHLIGSYLSGRNSADGYCSSCERFVGKPAPGGRSLGQFRRAIKEVSQELYIGGGAPLRGGAGNGRAPEGRPPRLLYPRDLQPPERGCPSLRMVIEELAPASS
jgi:hypothetical protein